MYGNLISVVFRTALPRVSAIAPDSEYLPNFSPAQNKQIFASFFQSYDVASCMWHRRKDGYASRRWAECGPLYTLGLLSFLLWIFVWLDQHLTLVTWYLAPSQPRTSYMGFIKSLYWLLRLLVLRAQSVTKEYIRAGNKRQSISYLFRTKIMKAQNSSKRT